MELGGEINKVKVQQYEFGNNGMVATEDIQKGDLINASSAAFTHHVYDTNYTVSRENVEWYRTKLPKDTELIDREAYVSKILSVID